MEISKLYQNKIRLVHSFLLLSVLLISVVYPACTNPAVSSTETTVKPESVGLSSDKLDEIGTVLNNDTSTDKINGAVLLVARDGKIAYFKSFGYRDDKRQLPMEKDSIFRVYSLTKSLTAVAVAMLMEEGKIALEDPVEKYIPSFKDVQVGKVTKDEAGKDVDTMVPPSQVMTIKNLATHTSGLSYWFLPAPGSIQQLYRQAGMNRIEGLTNAEVCEKLAKLPLVADPGTVYQYGMSYDVLGRIVEVVSGMTLDKFFEERIYKPLGMKNSGFRVTGENLNRVVYLNPQYPLFIDLTDPNRKFWSGGYGSVSTAIDWARFTQMLLNGGELEGKRLLKPETVALITSDQLGPLGNRDDAEYVPGPGYGVGFDFYVRVNTKDVDFPANVGEFTKSGITGPKFLVDPKEKLVVVWMMSTTDVGQRTAYGKLIQSMVNKSIIK